MQQQYLYTSVKTHLDSLMPESIYYLIWGLNYKTQTEWIHILHSKFVERKLKQWLYKHAVTCK